MNTVAITPDGRWAGSLAEDETLKIWDLEGGVEKLSLRGPRRAEAMEISPDGQRLLLAWSENKANTHSQKLKVWNLNTKAEELSLSRPSFSWVRAIAITPDWGKVVSALDDGTLRIWNPHTDAEELSLSGHLSTITAIAITPDGRRAVSASVDDTLKIWNLVTGKEEFSLSNLSSWVKRVAITQDGQRVISASNDRALKIWSLKERRLLASIVLDGPLECLALASDGLTILTGDKSGGVYCLRYVGPESNAQ